MSSFINQDTATASQASAGGERRSVELPNANELDAVDWTENIAVWAKDSFAEWDARARETLRKHPVLSLLAAFAFGSSSDRVATRNP